MEKPRVIKRGKESSAKFKPRMKEERVRAVKITSKTLLAKNFLKSF